MNDAVWLNEYFRMALEVSPIGQLIVDKLGVIQHANAKILNIFGYSLTELKGCQLELLVPDDFRQLHIRYRDQYFKTSVVRNMGTGQILYGQHKNGRKIPVEVGLAPLTRQEDDYILANVVDISERLKSEMRFQLALEASPSGLMLIDASGKVELINTKIEEIFGYNREDLIGKNIALLVPESYRARHPSFVEQFLSAPRARAMGSGRDLYGVHRNGKEVPVEIGLNPIDIDGKLHVLASVIDHSERLEAEKERQLLNNQIQHAQRMESLGILAGGTAHDFNNILAAISGNAELIQMMLPNSEHTSDKVIGYLHNIIGSCKRAEGLANQMLAYAGKGVITKSVVHINDIIQRSCGLLTSTLPKRITLETHLDPDLDPVELDEARFRQVLLNLVTNASEAIGDKPGKISITSGTGFISHSELIRFNVINQIAEGVYMYVEVTDTGTGMSEEIIDNIFDPFFTTKFTGRGLGMASVLGIIRSHHGGILIQSALNMGSSIKIIFPMRPLKENLL